MRPAADRRSDHRRFRRNQRMRAVAAVSPRASAGAEATTTDKPPGNLGSVQSGIAATIADLLPAARQALAPPAPSESGGANLGLVDKA